MTEDFVVHRLLATLFVVSLSFLSGCAMLRGDFVEPEVAIAGIRMGQAEGLYQPLFVDVVITNPNRKELALDGITYKIELQGHDLVKGTSREPLVVAAGGTARYTIPASLNLFSGVGLIRDLMSQQGKGALNYKFEAQLDPTSWWMPTINVDRSDSINLTR